MQSRAPGGAVGGGAGSRQATGFRSHGIRRGSPEIGRGAIGERGRRDPRGASGSSIRLPAVWALATGDSGTIVG
jgi:hypothetical protein